MKKDKELQGQRHLNLIQEEEMKKFSLHKEKLTHERQHLLTELKAQERELADMRATNDGQIRLIQNVTGH
jgi:hypothetical protein